MKLSYYYYTYRVGNKHDSKRLSQSSPVRIRTDPRQNPLGLHLLWKSRVRASQQKESKPPRIWLNNYDGTYTSHLQNHIARTHEQGCVACLNTLVSLFIPLGGTLRMSYKMNLPGTSPHFLPYPMNAWKVLKQAGYQDKTSQKRKTGMGIGVTGVKSMGNGGRWHLLKTAGELLGGRRWQIRETDSVEIQQL